MSIDSLFTEQENGQVTVSEEAKTIKEFKALITRDKGTKGDTQGRKKLQATKEFAYIYFYCNYNSAFKHYQEGEERHEKIKEALDLPEDWQVDKAVQAAIDRYRALQKSRLEKLLDSARYATDQLRDFFNKIDMDEKDNSGNFIYDSNKVIKSIKDLSNVYQGLNDLEEQVKQEQEESHRYRGGKKLNRFNT